MYLWHWFAVCFVHIVKKKKHWSNFVFHWVGMAHIPALSTFFIL